MFTTTSFPPDRPRTISGLLRSWADERPDSPFCGVEDRRYTFGEIDRRADEVAAAFARRGVAKGDRVAMLTPNRPEMLELFFGLARLSAVQVPLNAFLKGTFLEHQLADSTSSVLLVDRDGFDAVRPLLPSLPELRLIVGLDDELPPAEGVEQATFDDLVQDAGPAPEVAVAPGDTMSIVYTSGTTGLPKGCILSNGYYIRSGGVVVDALGIADDDVLFTSLPLFHGGARMMVLTAALLRGVPVTIDSAFSARRFFPRAREVGATIVVGIGAMGQALMATPETDADKDHGIHTMMIAPMSPGVQERFRRRFGIEPWTEIYGQTECTPLCAAPRSGERDRSGCGTPAPDLDVVLLDDDGREVGVGEVGEICIRPRAPHAMFDGYWNRPEETLSAIKDLWFHTGDLARRRESGQLMFADRKKDAMRRRGENVSSMELESAIAKHPAVAEVAVHAVPSPQSEDDVKACIVLAPDAGVDPEALFDHFRDNIPYFAVPRYVEILDELPRNAVGRVMKHVLRNREPIGEVWDFEQLGLSVAASDRRRTTATMGAR
jgi:crotonobetaine/carnitine-CoA ligase